MSAFEDQVRSLMKADRVEVPVDLDAVLDGGREAVRGRRLGWTVAGITVLGLVVSVVTPILIARTVPAVPAPALTPVATVAASPAGVPSLAGTLWSVIWLDGAAPVGGSRPALQFDAATVQGFDGCTTFAVTSVNGAPANAYRQDGDRLSIPSIARVVTGCQDAGLARQGDTLAAALTAVSRFTLADGRLQLIDASGRPRIELVGFSPDDITWRLVRWTGTGGDPTPVGALLVRGTGVSGTTSCGTFTAALSRAPGSWRMSAFEVRSHSCPFQANQASSRYLEALRAVTAATVGVGELRLHSAGGDLVFARE
jgi:hypothetical protein